MKTNERKNFRYKTTKNETSDFWEALIKVYQSAGTVSISRFGLIHALIQSLPVIDKKNYYLSRIKIAEQFVRFYWHPIVTLNLSHDPDDQSTPSLAEDIHHWIKDYTLSFTEISEFDKLQLFASVNRDDLENTLFEIYTDMKKMPYSFLKEGHSITLNPYFYQFLLQNRDSISALNLIEYVKTLISLNPDYSFVELLLEIDMNSGTASNTDFRYFFDVYAGKLSVYGLDLSDCQDYYREFLSFQADSVEEAILCDKLRNIDLSNISAKPYKPAPVSKSSGIIRNGIRVFERDAKNAANAMLRADLTCEMDPDHSLFLRRKDNLPYTKPFYLVPMRYSRQFPVSLDVEANIVSLCPLCYENVMYGMDAHDALEDLYMLRQNALEKCGITVSFQELLAMHGIK